MSDLLDMNTLSIALKRDREGDVDDAFASSNKKTASSMLLRQIVDHPFFRDTEIPLRLFFETLHRNAMRIEEPINIQLYAQVQRHMYRIPPIMAMERTKFSDVVRIDLIGDLNRQLETDSVLFFTYDFSYLSIFPSLQILHISHCHACLGSHLLSSVPNLVSFYMIDCEIFFQADDFALAMQSGKVTLLNVVERKSVFSSKKE